MTATVVETPAPDTAMSACSIMLRPPTSCRTLARADFMRVPAPAASTMAVIGSVCGLVLTRLLCRRAPRVGVEPTSLVRIQSAAGPADRPTGDRIPGPPDRPEIEFSVPESFRTTGYRERPGERQHGPPRARGIGVAEGGLVGDRELLAQVGGQRLQDGARAGAGYPVEHGVLALEHVQVGRLPHIYVPAEGGEQFEVRRRVHSSVRRYPPGVLAVRRLRRDLVQEGVAWCRVVAGYLQRERTARLDVRAEALDDGVLVGNPLEESIGDDQVDRFDRLPGRNIGELVARIGVGVVASRRVDHVRRGVDAVDPGLRPQRAEHRGEMPWSTPQVDDRARLGGDVRHQVHEWTGALTGELQVEMRVPAAHGALLSYCPASDIRRASSPRWAMSWIASGRPSSVSPAGIETAGTPAWFHCTV